MCDVELLSLVETTTLQCLDLSEVPGGQPENRTGGGRCVVQTLSRIQQQTPIRFFGILAVLSVAFRAAPEILWWANAIRAGWRVLPYSTELASYRGPAYQLLAEIT